MDVVFETGARSHEVDSCILYANNTSSLWYKSRAIYKKHIPCGTREEDVRILCKSFSAFLPEVLSEYERELGEKIVLTKEQREDFCRIFAEDYWSLDVQEFTLKEARQGSKECLDYSECIGRAFSSVAGGKMRVDDFILRILSKATTTENLLYVNCGQIDKKSYQKLNTVIEAMGGKWNSREKAHVFAGDPAESLDLVLSSGCLGAPEDFGFFPTPPEPAYNAVTLGDLEAGMRFLEPEAGTGNIADQAAEIVGIDNVDCIEIQEANRAVLKDKGYRVIGEDFLAMTPTPIYDRIVMNPPFRNHADIKHVERALQWLKPSGKLVSIMSGGVAFREDSATRSFRELAEHLGGQIIENPEGSFKESGTLVSTVTVVLPAAGFKRPDAEIEAEKGDIHDHRIIINKEHEESNVQMCLGI